MEKPTPPKGTSQPPVTPKPPVSKRRQHLRNANIGCGAAIFPLMLLFGATLDLTLKFALPILLIGLLAVPFCFKLNEDKGKGLWMLHIVRALTIGMLVIVSAAPIVCLGFSKTPLLYPLKRIIYAVGVRNYQGISTFAENKCLMPETLPPEHHDYYFRTEQALHGPDGPSPDAYLYFHTDQETLKQYAEELDAASEIECWHIEMPTELPEKESDFNNEDDWLIFKYRRIFGIPDDVAYFMIKGAGIRDEFSDIYYYHPNFPSGLKDTYGSGVIIHYQTGLFIAWD